ncbi:MAG: alpha/beta fold hydrolase [Kiritimatiellae bacterium]|nr:alpha/beta fold hydrolase [Kiritimatiellia bacterium]
MEELYAETEGNGPDVVFLHGLMGSCENWRTVRHALADRYRVTCLDLPCQGRSPHQPVFTLRSIADDVMASLDRLGIGRVALFGHSMGGRVAMQIATDYPDRIAGLGVVDMTVKAFRPVHLFVLRICRDLHVERFTRRAEIKAELAKWVPTEETCDFLLKNVVRDEDGRFMWRVDLDALIRCHSVVCDAPTLMAPYPGPAVFIVGAKSPFRVMRDEDAIRGWFPAVEFVQIPDAGHLVHIDQPDLFLAAATAAIDRFYGLSAG